MGEEDGEGLTAWGSRAARFALRGMLEKRFGEVFPVFLRKGTGSQEQVSSF